MRKKIKTFIIIIISIFILFYLFMIRYDIYKYYELRNCIVWSKNVKVEITDFEMAPDYSYSKDIHFWNGIYLHSNGFGNAKAIAIFDKSKSWVKDSTKFEPKKLLELQKLSFDLAEVYSRKMNKQIDKINYGKINNNLPWGNLAQSSKEIYDEYEKLNNSILYDQNKTIEEIIIYWRPKVEIMLIESK